MRAGAANHLGRAPASRTLPWLAWLALPWLLLAGGSAFGQSIGYTVQVVAVSDQDSALEIARGMLRDGFPAYVERATGGQGGDVYRVRVGAFANRAAALRYAEAMPMVAGSRPVPALAEGIPIGNMPLATRVVWQGEVDREAFDLRAMPWPQGLALRWQDLAGMRQATYLLVQDNEVRSLQAWWLAPLAVLPASPGLPPTDVPFVDLRTPEPVAPGEGEEAPDGGSPPVDDAGPEDDPADEGDPADEDAPEAEEEAPGEDPADEDGAAVDEDASAEDGAQDEAGEPSGDEEAGEADAAVPAELGPQLAPMDGPAEVGLLILRDRSLWPPTWEQDGEEVRAAFLRSTIALVAGRVGVPASVVEEVTYAPDRESPPAVVVVEVSDRSGRDVGDVRGLGDPRALPAGPPPAAGTSDLWWPPRDMGEAVPAEAQAGRVLEGADWTAIADDGFVRIAMDDGANWRAVAGEPLWSFGSYLLVRDGDVLVLVDFLAR